MSYAKPANGLRYWQKKGVVCPHETVQAHRRQPKPVQSVQLLLSSARFVGRPSKRDKLTGGLLSSTHAPALCSSPPMQALLPQSWRLQSSGAHVRLAKCPRPWGDLPHLPRARSFAVPNVPLDWRTDAVACGHGWGAFLTKKPHRDSIQVQSNFKLENTSRPPILIGGWSFL